MTGNRLQEMSNWAEDRAPLGSTPSADPAVGAEDRAVRQHTGPVLLQDNTFKTKVKPPTRELSATTNHPTSQLASAIVEKFQFTVNQDSFPTDR